MGILQLTINLHSFFRLWHHLLNVFSFPLFESALFFSPPEEFCLILSSFLLKWFLYFFWIVTPLFPYKCAHVWKCASHAVCVYVHVWLCEHWHGWTYVRVIWLCIHCYLWQVSQVKKLMVLQQGQSKVTFTTDKYNSIDNNNNNNKHKNTKELT